MPKKALGKFRLIHHLSYPEFNSINDHIPDRLCTLQYQSVDTAISLIQQLGPGALLAKTDIKNTYNQVPIHSTDFELLGFHYYYNKTLPFGLSYSCNLFEKFSTALQWILEHQFSVKHCVHILDDFLFIGPPNFSKCYSALMSFYKQAHDIGLPIKPSKTVLPTTTLTFLGFELDTVNFKSRLPQEKLVSSREDVLKLKSQKSATL